MDCRIEENLDHPGRGIKQTGPTNYRHETLFRLVKRVCERERRFRGAFSPLILPRPPKGRAKRLRGDVRIRFLERLIQSLTASSSNFLRTTAAHPPPTCPATAANSSKVLS